MLLSLRFSRLAIFFVFLAILLLGGAYLTGYFDGNNPEKDMANLLECADKYWELKKKGDWIAIYELIDPPTKKEISLQDFIKRHAGLLEFPNYKILEGKIQDDRGEVMVWYQMRWEHSFFRDNEPAEKESADEFVKIDGQWYKQYIEPTLTQKGRNKPLPPPKPTGRKLSDIAPPKDLKQAGQMSGTRKDSDEEEEEGEDEDE